MPSHKISDPLAALDALAPDLIPAALVRLAARMSAPVLPDTTASAGSDELLDPKQAAALLRTSTKYIYSHVRDLGGVRLGRGPRARLRFAKSKLLGWLGR